MFLFQVCTCITTWCFFSIIINALIVFVSSGGYSGIFASVSFSLSYGMIMLITYGHMCMMKMQEKMWRILSIDVFLSRILGFLE